MKTNVCIDNRSILPLPCLKKFQCLSSFLLQALLSVIAQGNSDLIDCEASQTGFWKKKVKTRRWLGVLTEWKVAVEQQFIDCWIWKKRLNKQTWNVLPKPVTHLAILYADRGEFDRKRFSPPIDADTPGDFFRRSRRSGTSTLFMW